MKKVYIILILSLVCFNGCVKSESNKDQNKNSNVKINTEVCCVIDIPEYSVVYALTPEGELNRYSEKKQYEKFVKAINEDAEFLVLGKGVKIKQKYSTMIFGMYVFTNGWFIDTTWRENAIWLDNQATEDIRELQIIRNKCCGTWESYNGNKLIKQLGIKGTLIGENVDLKNPSYGLVTNAFKFRKAYYIEKNNKYKFVFDGWDCTPGEYMQKKQAIIDSGKEWVEIYRIAPNWLDIPPEDFKLQDFYTSDFVYSWN